MYFSLSSKHVPSTFSQATINQVVITLSEFPM
jgi:hypothetical protein